MAGKTRICNIVHETKTEDCSKYTTEGAKTELDQMEDNGVM